MEFTATRLGEGATAGSFALFFDASDVGLTEPGEDLDAVEVVDETLHLSTTGSFSVNSGTAMVWGEDEDVFRCAGERGRGTDCALNLSRNLDGSSMGMDEEPEDVDAFAGTSAPSSGLEWVFSTAGPFSVRGASGQAADVFSCRGQECRPPASFRMAFRGSDHGMVTNIMAVDFARDP